MLVAAGADVNKAGFWSPLFEAAMNDQVEAVKALLKAGADMEKVDDRGYTPLMMATDCGEVEVVEVLLAAGVDLKKKSSQGKTALAISKERLAFQHHPDYNAINQGREQITSLLKQAGAKV